MLLLLYNKKLVVELINNDIIHSTTNTQLYFEKTIQIISPMSKNNQLMRCKIESLRRQAGYNYMV